MALHQALKQRAKANGKSSGEETTIDMYHHSDHQLKGNVHSNIRKRPQESDITEESSKNVQDGGLRFNIPLSGPRSHRRAEIVSDFSRQKIKCLFPYQIAHDDLRISTRRSWPTWRRGFRCSSSGLCALLNPPGWCCSSDSCCIRHSTTTTATAGSLTTGAEDVVERLVKLSAHYEMVVLFLKKLLMDEN